MGRLLQLLLLAALAWVIWRLVRNLLARRLPGPDAAQPPRFEPTVRCGRCGTHVPREQLGADGLCARCRPQP